MNAGGGQRQFLQQQQQILTFKQTHRQPHFALLEADPGVEQNPLLLLDAERQIRARRSVGEHPRPVDLLQGVAHLIDRHAGGVQPADDRTHAGAGDAIDGNPHFLQQLEHADMGDATRAAAAERQADAGAAPLDRVRRSLDKKPKNKTYHRKNERESAARTSE